MKHAVSISLGSSIRDKKVSVNFKGETIVIERIGMDGDSEKAKALFNEMDGKVDAFGVGGAELYIRVAEREYPLRAGLELIKGVSKTPAVDGRGVKHTLERQVMQLIEPQLEIPISPKKAMVTLGIDRFGMSQSIIEAGYEAVFCDFMFGLGLPIPVYGLKNVIRLGRVMMPIVGFMPISMIYDIGQDQEVITPKYQKWFNYGPLIAGDFIYIRTNLPDDLSGKTIVTNTTTAADVDLLRERGLRYLITTTPVFEGRSFGTNMLEAALTAYADKGRSLTTTEIKALLVALDIKPTLQKLN